MIDIIKTSICHECGHCMVCIIEGKDGSIMYADCEENLYAFPVQKGNHCPYFVKGEKDEKNPSTI